MFSFNIPIVAPIFAVTLIIENSTIKQGNFRLRCLAVPTLVIASLGAGALFMPSSSFAQTTKEPVGLADRIDDPPFI